MGHLIEIEAMPKPPTPNPNPALALVSMQNSMLPGTAVARGLGYLDDKGNVVIVTEDTPLPVTSGGSTDGLTNDQLRASPVEIYAMPRQVLSTTVTEFNAEISTQAIPAGDRSGVIIFVPEESVPMHIRFGSSEVSASSRSYTIQPGAGYQVPYEFASVAIQAMMTGAGNAFFTLFNLAD